MSEYSYLILQQQVEKEQKHQAGREDAFNKTFSFHC